MTEKGKGKLLDLWKWEEGGRGRGEWGKQAKGKEINGKEDR